MYILEGDSQSSEAYPFHRRHCPLGAPNDHRVDTCIAYNSHRGGSHATVTCIHAFQVVAKCRASAFLRVVFGYKYS